MNDQPAASFSPFSPSPPPTPMFEGEVAGKKPRKKRTKKAEAKPARKPRASNVTTSAPTEPKVPTRKRARVTRAPKFELGAFQAFAGLKEQDAKLLANLVAGLSTVNKKSRAKIVAALGKVFT